MPDKVILNYHDCQVHESDLQLLQGRNWLNDSLISFWFEHLMHEVFGHQARLLYISPEVTQLIKMGDATELPIFLDPLDVHSRTHIFLPVNDNDSVVSSGGSHWSLLVYSKYDNKWYHYDSLKGSNYRDAKCLVQRINKYIGKDIPASLVDAYCTQQGNSYDCGAYVMVYARRLSEMALKSEELSSCYVDGQEANRMRDLISSLVSSMRR